MPDDFTHQGKSGTLILFEVTARAITYYLDVSAECTRRIVSVDGAVKMLCNRLVAVDLESRTSKDLAEQCVKVCYSLVVIK
jgi:E3 ubiquitin-protein ligase HECTD1